ncbi:hypothetical protein ABZ348_14855 [Streptomyces sp. NPDC005963]|uniref:hypothetical protein n=1 Tax=Streptomyces sp. NPDC005963 TaxID=3156721 RepID=UPI0033C34883
MTKKTMPDLTGMAHRLPKPPEPLAHHENPAIESVVKRHDTSWAPDGSAGFPTIVLCRGGARDRCRRSSLGAAPVW